ncbi:MAG: hypothetical protein HYS06_04395 [Methylocystis sp.]|nr:hypothetical protein [Methylocystis sp.]
MKARVVDFGALCAISPQALRAYAQAEGWAPVEPYGNHSHVYVKATTGKEIIIPGTASLGDYASVVAELLKIFSETEGRDELQVYRDLTTADRDVVRIRSPEAENDGSVRVGAGVDLVTHARDLVLSAACAAWSPRPTYRAGRVKQADDYMSRVRLGQTEQGSFIVTLLAPVPPAIEQAEFWPSENEEPYERLVTRRLASSLDAAAQAIEKHNLGAGISIFENAVQYGVSANLCEAAANLSDQGDGVEVSITWARTRPTPKSRWTRTFTRSEGETLREVARIFHEKQPRPDEQVEGLIVKLARDERDFDGRVTMKAVVDGKLMSVQAQLQPRDYDLAIEAHRIQQPIATTGTLERIGRRWRLSTPTNVRLVQDDDLDDVNSGP